MKFIDLYNKNKDCADFIYRNKQFKLYSYLMKKNPGEFKIEWEGRFFRYYTKARNYYGEVCWEELDNSNGRYNKMGEYNRY